MTYLRHLRWTEKKPLSRESMRDTEARKFLRKEFFAQWIFCIAEIFTSKLKFLSIESWWNIENNYFSPKIRQFSE